MTAPPLPPAPPGPGVRVLTIAGSDTSAGAGEQADTATVLAVGATPLVTVTAVTAQDPGGVRGVWPVGDAALRGQLACVLDGIGAAAVKTGMLADAPTVVTVAAALAGRGLPLVVDPVLGATSGGGLLLPAAHTALRTRLLPLATVVTPNAAELVTLTGSDDPRGLLDGSRGPRWVLRTGGAGAVDVLVGSAGEAVALVGSVVDAGARRDDHGTGCTLSAALAAYLGAGWAVPDAAAAAKRWVQAGLRAGRDLGPRGAGTLDRGPGWPARTAAEPPVRIEPWSGDSRVG